jgi:hypothetical protein
VVVPDACVFCGASDLSSEHLLGDWMNKRLPLGVPHRHVVGATDENENIEITEAFLSDQHEVTVSCVCQARCNGGWMSNLESIVAPFLTDVALGSTAHVPERAFLVTALWAVKEMLVKQYQHPQPDPLLIPSDQYAHVYELLEPPPRTVVLQGRGPMIINRTTYAGLVWLRGLEVEYDVSDTVTKTSIGWSGRIAKAQFNCYVISTPGADEDPTGRFINSGLDHVQVWPLQTKASQIRVRHPRPPRS